MSTSTAGPTVWMFQYQIDIYDLLDEVAKGVRTDLWRASQHRQRIQAGERIYFLRASGGHGSDYAAIVAVGSTLSRVMPYECPGCYPWVVDVRFEALLKEPLTRDEMRKDPVLGTFRGRGYLP